LNNKGYENTVRWQPNIAHFIIIHLQELASNPDEIEDILVGGIIICFAMYLNPISDPAYRVEILGPITIDTKIMVQFKLYKKIHDHYINVTSIDVLTRLSLTSEFKINLQDKTVWCIQSTGVYGEDMHDSPD
jgi:hypothetical protein